MEGNFPWTGWNAWLGEARWALVVRVFVARYWWYSELPNCLHNHCISGKQTFPIASHEGPNPFDEVGMEEGIWVWNFE
jgi:hypothetical protein